MNDGLVIRYVEDIVRYYPGLKVIRLLWRGQFYDASLAYTGSEAIPRPDLYSAIWIGPERPHPIPLDEEPSNEYFKRSVSVALLFPKTLIQSASGNASVMTPFIAGGRPVSSQSNGSYFAGAYTKDGPFGLYVNPDGSVLIKANGSSIILGRDGTIINAKEILIPTSNKTNLLMKKNPLNFLPSMAVMPLPDEIPDIDKLDSIKSKLFGVLDALGI